MSFDRKNGSVYFAVMAQILVSANNGDSSLLKSPLEILYIKHDSKNRMGLLSVTVTMSNIL